MKVKQLIAHLQKGDPSNEVLVSAPNYLYKIGRKKQGWIALKYNKELQRKIIISSEVFSSLDKCKEAMQDHAHYKDITYQFATVIEASEEL